MFKRIGKIRFILMVFLIMGVSAGLVCCGKADGQAGKDHSDQALSEKNDKDDSSVKKDLSEKMDTAIRMLTVIKQELDTPQTTPSDGKTTWSDEIKARTDQGVRVIEKLKSAADPGAPPPQPGEIGSKEWNEQFKQNVDTLANVGEKVGKVISEYTTGSYTTQAASSETLQSRIDKTIRVLDAVKQGLNESQNTESSSGTNAEKDKK